MMGQLGCMGILPTCDRTRALAAISSTSRCFWTGVAKSTQRCRTQQPWRCVAMSLVCPQAASYTNWLSSGPRRCRHRWMTWLPLRSRMSATTPPLRESITKRTCIHAYQADQPCQMAGGDWNDQIIGLASDRVILGVACQAPSASYPVSLPEHCHEGSAGWHDGGSNFDGGSTFKKVCMLIVRRYIKSRPRIRQAMEGCCCYE